MRCSGFATSCVSLQAPNTELNAIERHDFRGLLRDVVQDTAQRPRYDRDYYTVSPQKIPKGPATGAYRAVRGGSFFAGGS